MTDAREQYDAAIEIANTAREAWTEDQSRENFTAWRDASDIAIKWGRAMRLGGEDAEEAAEDPFAEFDRLAEQRIAERGAGPPSDSPCVDRESTPSKKEQAA